MHHRPAYDGHMTEEMREPTYLLLAALAGGPKHGYGLMQEVAALSGGRVRLGAGTLYGALERLAREGLVVQDGEQVVAGRLRRSYRLDPEGTTGLAKEVAEELQAAHPTQVTATMTKARRSGKVFLDWSQNAGSKTTLSPYSLRGRERPWVATPLSWDEVEEGADDPLALEQMGFDQVLQRVADRGDLLSPLAG